MKLAVLSVGAGFHCTNNTVPILKEFGAEFVEWHQAHKVADFDAIYILGWYVNTMQLAQQHMNLLKMGKPVIVHWAGSDILKMKEYAKTTDISSIVEALNQDHVTCTVGREQVKKEVEEIGVRNIKLCPVASRKNYVPTPLPIKQGTKKHPIKMAPLVTVYMPPLRAKFFNLDIVMDVARELPDIPFILYAFTCSNEQTRLLPNVSVWGKLSEKTFDQLIDVSSIHLRIVDHDGLSLSVIENCMAGRRVVCNQEYPNIKPVKKHVKSIVAAIKKAAKETEPDTEISEFYTKNYGPENQRKIVGEILEEAGLCLKA